jgi:hypothetical protein
MQTEIRTPFISGLLQASIDLNPQPKTFVNTDAKRFPGKRIDRKKPNFFTKSLKNQMAAKNRTK